MDKLIVQGRKRLVGEVNISGAKNAAVAVIPCGYHGRGRQCIGKPAPH